MKKNPLVSIIIPTRNSQEFLEKCLRNIERQSYKKIEVIIVDGNSTDNTITIARRHKVKILQFDSKAGANQFDAPQKRNYGVKQAKGELVYYVDTDMEISKDVVKDSVALCVKKYDAVIIPEISIGEGIWAKAKNLEKICYIGDDAVEAPRFFKKEKWEKVGGLDSSLGGGGDDWDLYQKFLDRKYTVARTKKMVWHNEGNLKLSKLIKKRFMYGKDSLKYISKRRKEGIISYFPIRSSYLRNWKLFASRPRDTFFFIIMRFFEYSAGVSGMIYSIIKK